MQVQKPKSDSNLDSNLEMLPKIRCLITMRVESSILSNRQKHSRYYHQGHQSVTGKSAGPRMEP